MTIKNTDEVVNQLAEILKEFDSEMHPYQTDVYMYVDEDGNAELETFENVGGNNWLNDEHITIYSDKEHFEKKTDVFGDIKELADCVLGIPESELIEKVIMYNDWDDDAVVTWSDCAEFIEEEYSYDLDVAYETFYVRENNYRKEAESIIESFGRNNHKDIIFE